MPTKATNSSEHTQNKHKNVDLSQWDTLMLTLRIGRVFGVAPVHFQKELDGRPVIVPKADTIIYSRLIILLLHVSIVIGTVIDWQGGSNSVRVQEGWSCFNWLFELTTLGLITTIGTFGAPERLKRTYAYLDTIDKVKSNIVSPKECKTTRIPIFVTICYIISASILFAADFYMYYRDIVIEEKNYTVMYLYSCFYVELMVVILLELEFMWAAMFVHAGLEAVNSIMEGLIFFIDVQRSISTVTADGLLEMETIYIPRPVNHVNTMVDQMPSQWYNNAESQNFRTWKYVPESMRRIAHSYCTICDVIAGINDNYGILLLLFVASFILHFIVTPFYFFNYLNSNRPRSGELIVQIIFVVYHFSYMLIVVEPGYLTEKQNEYTKTLARHLLQRVSSPKDPMLAELDILLKHIDLNKVYYSPLKFCRLNRSLITVILSGATTYLVVILQFQRMK